MTKLRHTSKSSRSRSSGQRAKQDERDIARILGGKRYPANMGGPLDIEHPWLGLQVKGNVRVEWWRLKEGLDAAKAGSVGKNLLPAVVAVDRSGTKVRRFIMFELIEFADWNGLGESEGADTEVQAPDAD